ncbi:MAG: Gfo/Idh/MocA family oxidoreductase [Phycisphaerae bacterium]|nr:Gfo/Idh/MocA family oxidoreductase [Phycisphaerae bacterium]
MRTIRVALVGGGMFGKDVVLRCLSDVQRCGIGPYLGTAGLDHRARDLAGVRYEVVAVGTRTAHSGEALASTYRAWVPDADVTAHYGDMPWCSILDERRPDVLFVATPDHLHAAPILAAVERGVHVVAEKPLTLSLKEARSIAAQSKSAGTVVAVDMHKRYDSFLRSAFRRFASKSGSISFLPAIRAARYNH